MDKKVFLSFSFKSNMNLRNLRVPEESLPAGSGGKLEVTSTSCLGRVESCEGMQSCYSASRTGA